MYRYIADRVDDQKVLPTEEDIHESATDFSVSNIGKYSSRDLYMELSKRLLDLAEMLNEMILEDGTRALAPAMFRAMQQSRFWLSEQ